MSNRFDTVEFVVDDGSYHARYDPETTAPSIVVVEIVQTVFDRDCTELDPLYESIDPEALDRVLEPTARRDQHGRRTVTFSFQDSRITVSSDGLVTVRPCADVDH